VFKIRADKAWDSSYGMWEGSTNISVGSTYGLKADLEGVNIKLSAAGNYVVRFYEATADFIALPVITELYILGDAVSTGWSLDDMEAFTAGEGSVFTWTGAITANKEFRFPLQKVSDTWWPCLVKGTDDGWLAFGWSDADKNQIPVTEDGTYTITVTAANPFEISYTIVKQ